MLSLFKFLKKNHEVSSLAHRSYKATGPSFPVALDRSSSIYHTANFFYNQTPTPSRGALEKRAGNEAAVLKKKIKKIKIRMSPLKYLPKPLLGNFVKKKHRVLYLKSPLKGPNFNPKKGATPLMNFLKTNKLTKVSKLIKISTTKSLKAHAQAHVSMKAAIKPTKPIIVLKVSKKTQPHVKVKDLKRARTLSPLKPLALKVLNPTLIIRFKKRPRYGSSTKI